MRVQDQIGFGSGRRILAKGIVQQVIEDLAIERGVFAQIALELVQRVVATVIRVAGADRQPRSSLSLSGSVCVLRSNMICRRCSILRRNR